MNEVPTVKSLICPDFLADFLFEEYGFDPPMDCRLVKTGDNDTYKITSNGEYFSLRISRANRAHIKSDDELLFDFVETWVYSIVFRRRYSFAGRDA